MFLRRLIQGDSDLDSQPASKMPEFSIDAALRLRLPHWHPDFPFLVAWAQKAGCTSVLKWFLYQVDHLDRASRYMSDSPGLDIHSYEMEVFKAGPAYKASVAEALQKGLPVINFVRCPYQRAFSSYMQIHNRFYINQEHKGIDSPGIRTRRSVLRFVYGEDVSVEYPVSFLEYLQWLEQSVPAELDPHHSPQHSAIYRYPGIRHYRLEDFDAVSRDLAQEYGLKSADAGQLAPMLHECAGEGDIFPAAVP